MSEFQSNLLTGLAVLLHNASLGTWRATGSYTTDETAIVLGKLPQAPERAIALTPYPVADDPSLSTSVVGVQMRLRWGGADPRPVQDLSDTLFAYLHGKHNFVLSTGISIVHCLRNSGLSMGQDQNNRWEHSDNYYLTVWRPSTNRT